METSSRGNLAFGEAPDVSAIGGEAGTWLLDPEDILIDSTGAASISSALDNGSNVLKHDHIAGRRVVTQIERAPAAHQFTPPIGSQYSDLFLPLFKAFVDEW